MWIWPNYNKTATQRSVFCVCQYKRCSVARLPARNLEIGWKLVSREGEGGGGGLRLSQALTNMASGVGKSVIGIFAFSDSKVVIYYQWLWSRATHCYWEWYTAVCQCRTFDSWRTHTYWTMCREYTWNNWHVRTHIDHTAHCWSPIILIGLWSLMIYLCRISSDRQPMLKDIIMIISLCATLENSFLEGKCLLYADKPGEGHDCQYTYVFDAK